MPEPMRTGVANHLIRRGDTLCRIKKTCIRTDPTKKNMIHMGASGVLVDRGVRYEKHASWAIISGLFATSITLLHAVDPYLVLPGLGGAHCLLG